ncbi:MAG: hypothetical protein ACT4OI_04700 [Methanobacteriota archaeon]
MPERRILAIVGLILGLVAGVLLLVDTFQLRGNQAITLEFLLDRAVEFVVSLGILFGSLLLFRAKYSAGGLLNLVLGIAALVLAYDTTAGALAVVSGILGLVATQAKA